MLRTKDTPKKQIGAMFAHNQRRMDWLNADPEKRGTNEGLGTKRGTTVRSLQQLTGA